MDSTIFSNPLKVDNTIIIAKDPTPKPSIAMAVMILMALIFFLEKR
jgi:hypothetical protein